MTDFVLSNEVKSTLEYFDAYKLIRNYANFIKQPLELWMFVPCGEDGNFLEKPIETIGGIEMYYDKYQQAKERCLFEECVYDEEMDAVRNDIGLMIYSVKYDSNDNVEDLIKYELQLTQTAIKQLGL